MGFFKAKKTIYVSSSVYNLAGGDEDRVNYLKTVVVGKVIADTSPSTSLGEAITNSYLNGPGLKLRSFGKWAVNSGYNDMLGMQSGTLYLGDSIDDEALKAYLPVPSGSTAVLQSAEIGFADFSWWADQYIVENHPELLNTDYASDYNEATGIITINYADGTSETFTPTNYDESSKYLYAAYFVSSGDETGPLVPGTPVALGSTDPFPSTDGWTTDSTSSLNTNYNLLTQTDVVVSYSDGRPDETSHAESTTVETAPVIDNRYHKSEFQGASSSGSDQVSTTEDSFRYDYQTNQVVNNDPEETTGTETLPDGTIKTTKTTVSSQSVERSRGYRVDTQIVTSSLSSSNVFIYKYGSGEAALDAMFAANASVGGFLPFIPVRVDNDMIDDNRFDDYYLLIEKAYKKAVRAKFTELIDKVKDNESIGDIDYAYCVFGVSLNVKDNACRKYVYTFFENLLESVGNNPAYNNYRTQMAAASASNQAFAAWSAAQSDSTNPLYGTPQPSVLSYPSLPTQGVQVKSNGLMNFNMIINWSNLAKTTGSGMKDSTHVVGDCWFEIGTGDDYDQIIFNGSTSASNSFSVNHIIIYKQDSATEYSAMHVYGLRHINKIYGGKSVDIDGKDAINDSEESGFIIPVQRDIFQSFSLKDATQMSTACNIMVFNCYQVVKQKWYQTSWFKVVLIIIVIVVSIFTAGAGAGAGAGLLGTAASVGAAVGLTGVAAIIVGTIANALAAMLLMKLIGVAATALFGEKYGAIVGAVASVIAVAVGTSYANGGSISAGFSSLTRAENIIRLTEAAGNGYAQYMQAAVNETIKETQDVLDNYQDKMKDIAEKYNDMFGTDSTGYIDPLKITEATNLMLESQDSFLSRTMMTGEDIANLSLGLITNFTDIMISTDLPG